MKTITNYPGKAKRAKAILIAGLISIQAALIAGDSSSVNKEFAITNDAYIASTELMPELTKEKDLKKSIIQALIFMCGLFLIIFLVILLPHE